MEYLRTIRLRDGILALSVFGVTAMAAVQWYAAQWQVFNGTSCSEEVYAPSVQTADELVILCKLKWEIWSSSKNT
jgi:hypothetical protein